MNLNKVFNIITEAAEVNKIKASVGDKIPTSVMDKLIDSAKETKKGRFFDNEAMAIIKSISGGNKDEFLLNHPTAVHGILKKLKKGDSSFDAAKVLADGEGKEYWKGLYKENKKEKNVEKDSFGFKNARVKSIDDKWFAIIPKNFYDKNSEKELKNIDIEKSHKELQTLSNELAKRDTSEDGTEAPTWGDAEGKNKYSPRVNHWCVAATKNVYYRDYTSDEIFLFIIFVKKNQDGSPNWNERYLWYAGGRREEFADKFDKHVGVYDILSPKAIKLIDKIKSSVDDSSLKKIRFIKKIQDDAEIKAEKDRDEFFKYEATHPQKKIAAEIKFDDEMIKVLSSRRRELSKEEEKKVILKAIPWIDEAYSDRSIINYCYQKSKIDRKFGGSIKFMFTEDFHNIVLICDPRYDEKKIVIIKSDKPLKQSYFSNMHVTSATALDNISNSTVYNLNTESFKAAINFLRSIVGNSKSRVSYKKDETINDLKELMSPLKVYEKFEPEINVHPKLSKKAQRYFDVSYYSVFPELKAKISSTKNNKTLRYFYNNDLKLVFMVSFNERSGAYDISYQDIDNYLARGYDFLVAFNGKNTEEVKRAFRELAQKRKKELEKNVILGEA